jgi:hypothetical protein
MKQHILIAFLYLFVKLRHPEPQRQAASEQLQILASLRPKLAFISRP